MPTSTPDKDRRKWRRFEALGTTTPRCGTCGDERWQCLELHHVADHGRDDRTVILCRNCHRVASDDQRDHPTFDPKADPTLDRIGHFLLGLADLLRLIVEKLLTFGNALIARAAATPIEGDI